jgi:N-carbamoylputrescine amidase
METKFTVALVQMAMSADPEETLARALEKIRQAAAQGAQVICLPELFRWPYFCQREDAALFDLAEPVPGPTTRAISQAASSMIRSAMTPGRIRASSAL